MDKRCCWTKFAVPLRHFRDKGWFMKGCAECSIGKIGGSPVPGTEHSRKSHALRVAVDVPSRMEVEWKSHVGAHRVLFNSHGNSCVRCS